MAQTTDARTILRLRRSIRLFNKNVLFSIEHQTTENASYTQSPDGDTQQQLAFISLAIYLQDSENWY